MIIVCQFADSLVERSSSTAGIRPFPRPGGLNAARRAATTRCSPAIQSGASVRFCPPPPDIRNGPALCGDSAAIVRHLPPRSVCWRRRESRPSDRTHDASQHLPRRRQTRIAVVPGATRRRLTKKREPQMWFPLCAMQKTLTPELRQERRQPAWSVR